MCWLLTNIVSYGMYMTLLAAHMESHSQTDAKNKNEL